VTALLLIGFVAGLWLDWLLRRLDRSRSVARENLGIEMQSTGREIQVGTDLWVNIGPLSAGPRLHACFVKAEKLGLWYPDDRTFQVRPLFADRIQHTLLMYLLHVGKLLSDGHFAEAKRVALQSKEAFAKVLAENERENEKTKRK
jgi:hypothetical protein